MHHNCTVKCCGDKENGVEVMLLLVCLGVRGTSIKLAAKSLYLERQGNKINKSCKLDFNIPQRLSVFSSYLIAKKVSNIFSVYCIFVLLSIN